MLYTSQMGIKVSICEFFKDLISHETITNSLKSFQEVIRLQVISQLIDFLAEDDDLIGLPDKQASVDG